MVLQRSEGSGGVITLLLVVVAVAAMAEVVAGRSVASLESPRPVAWEVSLRTGDEARARGDAPAARRAYLTALFRARRDRSLTGVVRAAEGFEALGDREVVEQALKVAAEMSAKDGDGAVAARLHALRERLDAEAALPAAVGVRQ